MGKRKEKPPIGGFIEQRAGSIRLAVQPTCVYLTDIRRDVCIGIRSADFDALVRWYTGTEKQPRATKGPQGSIGYD